jgi:plasmid stabilization system protein ParE
MPLDVIWTAGAERDLLEIHRVWFDLLGQSDARITQVLELPLQSAMNLLAEHPEVGAKVRGVPRMRRWLMGPQRRYGLFYVVEPRGILIHAMLDLRQSPEFIQKRLTRN